MTTEEELKEWEENLKGFNLMVERTTRDELIQKIQKSMTPAQIERMKEYMLRDKRLNQLSELDEKGPNPFSRG